MCGVVSHELLAVVGRGGLADDRHVSARADRNAVADHLVAQIF